MARIGPRWRLRKYSMLSGDILPTSEPIASKRFWFRRSGYRRMVEANVSLRLAGKPQRYELIQD